MRTIVIEIEQDNYFTIREGDRFVDKLCWDEMLGTIAELTHQKVGECRYRMETAEQAAQREAKHQERMAEVRAAQKQEAKEWAEFRAWKESLQGLDREALDHVCVGKPPF